MIDYFALALTHGLMAIAAWRLIQRRDLDSEPAAAPTATAVADAAKANRRA